MDDLERETWKAENARLCERIRELEAFREASVNGSPELIFLKVFETLSEKAERHVEQEERKTNIAYEKLQLSDRPWDRDARAFIVEMLRMRFTRIDPSGPQWKAVVDDACSLADELDVRRKTRRDVDADLDDKVPSTVPPPSGDR